MLGVVKEVGLLERERGVLPGNFPSGTADLPGRGVG